MYVFGIRFSLKQKTAYEMRISYWSSDVCSSDLHAPGHKLEIIDQRDHAGLTLHLAGDAGQTHHRVETAAGIDVLAQCRVIGVDVFAQIRVIDRGHMRFICERQCDADTAADIAEQAEQRRAVTARSEEHTSELQSLMRISYAVFCLKKKKTQHTTSITTY